MAVRRSRVRNRPPEPDAERPPKRIRNEEGSMQGNTPEDTHQESPGGSTGSAPDPPTGPIENCQ